MGYAARSTLFSDISRETAMTGIAQEQAKAVDTKQLAKNSIRPHFFLIAIRPVDTKIGDF